MPDAPASIFEPPIGGGPSNAPAAIFSGRAIPDDGAWHLITTLGGNRDIHWKWTGASPLAIVYEVPAGVNPTPYAAVYAANVLTISLPLTGSPGSAVLSMTASGLIAASITGMPPGGVLTRTLATGSDGSGILGAMAETDLETLTPDAPPAIFEPAGGGGSPGDPPEIFEPAGSGGSPDAPPAVFQPATAGATPAMPPYVFIPGLGRGLLNTDKTPLTNTDNEPLL